MTDRERDGLAVKGEKQGFTKSGYNYWNFKYLQKSWRKATKVKCLKLYFIELGPVQMK